MKIIAKETEVEERIKSQEPGYRPIDKETALRYIECIEMKKSKHMAGIMVA